MKCSKCGFENPLNAKYCLNCGHKLSLDVAKEEIVKESEVGFNAKRKKVDEVFNRVALILSIVLFSVSLVVVFSKFLTVGNDNFIFGTAYQYLVGNWFNFSDVDIALKTTIIASFIFVINNILITYVFGIIGLIKTIRALKNNERFAFHKYLSIVLVSNILMLALLKSFKLSDTYELYNSYIFMMASALFIMYCFQAFLEFDKNMISLFIKRIFMSLAFFMCLVLIANISNTFIFDKNAVSYSVIELSLRYLIDVFNGSLTSNEDIIMMTFVSGLLIFEVMELILCCSLAIYLTNGYFTKSNNKKSLIIPTYIVSFAIAILSAVILTVGLIIGGFMISANNGLYFGGYLFSNFVVALLLLGSLMASLYILKGYLRNKKN